MAGLLTPDEALTLMKIIEDWQFEEWLKANFSPFELIVTGQDLGDYYREYQEYCEATKGEE